MFVADIKQIKAPFNPLLTVLLLCSEDKFIQILYILSCDDSDMNTTSACREIKAGRELLQLLSYDWTITDPCDLQECLSPTPSGGLHGPLVWRKYEQ